MKTKRAYDKSVYSWSWRTGTLSRSYSYSDYLYEKWVGDGGGTKTLICLWGFLS